jgi:hypothetical protein
MPKVIGTLLRKKKTTTDCLKICIFRGKAQTCFCALIPYNTTKNSRMPVYEKVEEDPDDRTAILGFLMIRQLILIDWDHGRKLSTLPLQRPDCVSPRMNLVDALELLRTGGTLMVRHMYAIHS